MHTDFPDDRVRPGLPASMPAPVQAAEVADLISYIQHTLGFPPRNSLAAISMSGRNLGAVLRCDWVPGTVRTWADHSANARQFAGHLARDQLADGCVAVLFRDDDWQVEVDAACAGWRGADRERARAGEPGNGSGHALDPTSKSDRLLAAALERELSAAGLPLMEFWLVARGRLWHVDCPAPGSCSDHGTPASWAETSVVNTSLIVEGSVVEEEPRGSGLPSAAEAISVELACALENIRKVGHEVSDEDEAEALEELVSWIGAWERILAGEGLPENPTERAVLMAGLLLVEWRDCLLAAASFTLERALSGAAWIGTLPVEASSVFDAEPREVNGVLYSSVILAASRRAPDWERVAHLKNACTGLLPEAAGPVASALRCLAAWVEWARGRGSAAGRILLECRHEDPDYPLGQLLGEIVDRGMLSGWAARRETAWSATARRTD
ncbi:DUF4192 family protein [Citricoccus alkalitolerans]|uniref:DUF4192 family protein n=1 Tax=Citricoccus alkalitolerans TaxID=246603 RepID=A0ABV8XYR0_9MICC